MKALTRDQRARAEALRQASESLGLYRRQPDAIDLVTVAQFILDGEDPWPLNDQPQPPEPRRRITLGPSGIHIETKETNS